MARSGSTRCLLVDQIDPVRLEAPARRVDDLLDVFGPAVESASRTVSRTTLNPDFVAVTMSSHFGASVSPTVPRW
jgi:hypothetical protein